MNLFTRVLLPSDTHHGFTGIEAMCCQVQEPASSTGEVQNAPAMDRREPATQHTAFLGIDVGPVRILEAVAIIALSELIVVIDYLRMLTNR